MFLFLAVNVNAFSLLSLIRLSVGGVAGLVIRRGGWIASTAVYYLVLCPIEKGSFYYCLLRLQFLCLIAISFRSFPLTTGNGQRRWQP